MQSQCIMMWISIQICRKKLFRPAMELFRKKHYPNRNPAFDGRKNLYSCGFLPFTNEIHDTIVVFDNERQRDKEFKITIKLASQVDMSALLTYAQNGGRTIPQDAIQALDIVLRNPASMSFTQVGRSFFTPPKGQVLDLGDGMELWYGFYQSAILGWKPYLNIDVAHKGFPTAKYLIEVAMDVRRTQDVRDLRNPFDRNEAAMFEKTVKNLKVEYELPNQPNSRRTYKVHKLEKPAGEARFTLENNSTMTVGEYFAKEKRILLKFPAMPCVHVGNEKKNIFLPIEFCKIQAGQVVNAKLNEIQTANMVRAAAKPADVRKQRIMDAMRQANFNADKCVNEFGITVSQEFTKVGARILDPPKLEYQNNQTVLPNKGVWRPMRFLKTNTLLQWCILNLDFRTREQDCWKFGDTMISTGRQLGITIEKPYDVKTLNMRGPDKRPIIDYFDKNKSAQLIVVIFNDRDAGMYGKVKQCAELSVGVLTQCIRSKTMFKMNPATASNILLKVNSKLNGVNHQIDKSCRPSIFNAPIMIVGADVTHPSPDQKTIPSVAAVAASHDPAAFQYNMLWRLQPPRQEMIEDLEEMMKTQLKFFYQKTKQKPFKIIFYRDGVSEGQFSQVLDIELKAIRRACTGLQSDFNPKITFLVVQKRHHTRFFPTNPRDEDGKNKNVPAGTIVDTEITHPREMDFYLVSHASLQGTSRPTKYHKLWDDNDMDEDDLEELTYYLCHLFSRCTRSVSYPAPTYYAHLAAFRARCYIEGTPIQIGNLQREQETRMIQTAIVQNSPMFFV
uniref:Uncharacterized protein n=1 Tax=Clastoptera arizonana TaxID=38151 RepID=A0A1B6E7E6_9HEMI